MFNQFAPILIALLVIGNSSYCQVISFNQYMDQVRSNHPVVKQADIQLELGDASVLFARGSFDPKIVSSLREKYFSDEQYYSELNAAVQVPTWFGVQLETGFDQNIGNYASPNTATSSSGLLYGGVSVPIGKGLMVDRRRNELAKAKIYRESTGAIQAEMKNRLFLDAANAYWDWYEAWNRKSIYEEAVKTSLQRYNGVRSSVELGDRSPIDSVEAKIQLQNRQIQLQEETVKSINARIQVSRFLWLEGMVPLELKEDATPESRQALSSLPMDELMRDSLDKLIENHPSLRMQSFEIAGLNQEMKYKREQLKPKFDLKYRPLSSPGSEFSFQNYSWGVDLAFPIFLRSARGQLAMTKIKKDQSSFKLIDKTMQVRTKSNQSFNKWKLSYDLYFQQSSVVSNYKIMFDGETQLFNGGESSLFLVNQRELAFIKSKLKLNSMMTKNQKAVIETKYNVGNLYK